MVVLARAAYQPVGTDAAVRICPETPFGARDRRARRDSTPARLLRRRLDMAPFIRTDRTRRIDSVGRGIDGRVSRTCRVTTKHLPNQGWNAGAMQPRARSRDQRQRSTAPTPDRDTAIEKVAEPLAATITDQDDGSDRNIAHDSIGPQPVQWLL
jgi:hypothetical protein